MKDSWPAPMATSEMPRGESRLDSPFLQAVERYHELLVRLPLPRLKCLGPVKSVSVIVPRRRRRRRWLISCPGTKIAVEKRKRERKRKENGEREREARDK